MSRRFQRHRRPLLIALYISLLGFWAALAYDTYGLWLGKQAAVARGLAAAATGPTPRPPGATAVATVVAAATTATVPAPAATEIAAEATALALQPTRTPAPPAMVHPKTGRYVAAWLPTSFDADKARASFEANKDILDEISPFWYSLRPSDGQLVPEDGARDRSLVDAAHKADVLVLPTVHNVANPLAIVPLLRDPNRRKQHISAIMADVRSYQYDGIDVDYESLPADTRAAYSDFMRELSTALHAEGKLLTVAVHAKSSDGGGLGAFQDWPLLGQICDRVRVMTYDFHWRGGGPGPIAPLKWVSEVGEYAQAVIPAGKVEVGIPFYAYNWSGGSEALAQTWVDVQHILGERQPDVNLMEVDASGPVEESWFAYHDGSKTHTVWFASYRSLEAKLDLVEKQDLGGVAIWRLGNEDPRNWDVIRKQLVDSPAVIQRMIDTYLPEH